MKEPRAGTGRAPGGHQAGTGRAPGVHRAGTGRAPGGHRAGSGPGDAGSDGHRPPFNNLSKNLHKKTLVRELIVKNHIAHVVLNSNMFHNLRSKAFGNTAILAVRT